IILGASAVQIGSRFVASNEASCHINFKNSVLQSQEGDTQLSLKALTPVRLLKNEFYQQVAAAEQNCASREQLQALLGRGRAKKGMYEGNVQEGELEIGQVSALIKTLQPAGEIVTEIWQEYQSLRALC
ncbi:MAG: nitronate monooxygenase, partial [Chitinophagaceae bacterium]